MNYIPHRSQCCARNVGSSMQSTEHREQQRRGLGVNLWLCPTMPFVPTLPLQPSIVSTCTVQRHPGPTLFFFFSFQCNQKCRSTRRCMTNSAPKSMHYNVPLFQSFVAYFPEICGATKFGSAYHCKADSANSFANLKFVFWCVCLFFVAYTSSKHINIQLTEQITVRMGSEISGLGCARNTSGDSVTKSV